MTPGVHDALPEADYFASPALSASGAKLLLPPNCPAIYKWTRDNGQPHRAAFDNGHMAHKQVLGVGAPLQLVEADDWRTKAAKEQRDAAYASGAVPLLSKDWDAVRQMAAKLREHPVASALLDPAHGNPEQSLFRTCDRTGVELRARVDWLGDVDSTGRLIITDYKTAAGALDLHSLSGVMARYRYDLQAAFYRDMALALGLAETVAFVLVFQSKTAPHLVRVVEPDADALFCGGRDYRKAVDVFATCNRTGMWPGYDDDQDIPLLSLPRWAGSTNDDTEDIAA